MAAIFDEQIAWDTVKYWVSAFAETRKPRILHIEMYFFNDFIDQMREKSLIFMKNHLLSFEKTCFRGVKTRVLGTLISLKISKIVPSDALARVLRGVNKSPEEPKMPAHEKLVLSLEFLGGPKEPKRADNC